jgi:hypothetical protein
MTKNKLGGVPAIYESWRREKDPSITPEQLVAKIAELTINGLVDLSISRDKAGAIGRRKGLDPVKEIVRTTHAEMRAKLGGNPSEKEFIRELKKNRPPTTANQRVNDWWEDFCKGDKSISNWWKALNKG